MVIKQSGFSLVETLIGLGILSLGALGILNLSKQEAQGSKLIGLQEISSQLTKELLVMLEHKTYCEGIFQGKGHNDNVSFQSSDGIVYSTGTLIQNKFLISQLSLSMPSVSDLPPGLGLATVYFAISSKDGKGKTVEKISFLANLSGNKILSCVTPKMDGEQLIERKAVEIAKNKVCTEDLKGTLLSNGTCNWKQPVNYEYVEIQL